ncbi:hypothetical protein JXR93_08955 [bacterium]|nr:hypothetical protein [bacterium]
MRKILLLIVVSLFFIGCEPPTYDVDTDSPYVKSVQIGSTSLDIAKASNISFEDDIIETTTNIDIAFDEDIIITFSEKMYSGSLAELGKSDTVVLIPEENYSRSLLSDIGSPPLSDTNVAKIHPCYVEFNTTTQNTLTLKLSEDSANLQSNRKYALVISKTVMDSNGRELTVKYQENGKEVSRNENLVIIFKTE